MQTFIAGFTAAGETSSPPMEQTQGHSQTQISIILFLYHKSKRKKKRLGGGWGQIEEVKGRRSALGFGAKTLRKETTGGLRARGSVFQLKFSLSRKALYRLADPLSLSQSFLPLSAMQNPAPSSSQITLLRWTVAVYELLHRERCSCPDSLPCFLFTAGGHSFVFSYILCFKLATFRLAVTKSLSRHT